LIVVLPLRQMRIVFVDLCRHALSINVCARCHRSILILVARLPLVDRFGLLHSLARI
jgi:hypothetical protein